MSAAELTSAAADLVTAIATLGAVVVAGVGLRTWRKELKGRADFETARQLARDTYALREALGTFRAPLYSSAEFPDGDIDSAEGYASMFQNRWRPLGAALATFESTSLEAEALWGAPVREKTDRLRRCVVRVFVAVEAFVDDKRSGGRDFKSDPDFGKRTRADVAGTPDSETNQMSVEIAAAVRDIEDFLKTHLVRK